MTDQKKQRHKERDASEPVRPETVQEDEGVAPSQQKDPPKAEGNRDEADGGDARKEGSTGDRS